MHPAGTVGPHATRRPRRGAILEAGAAVRTLVARLVMAGACPTRHRPPATARRKSRGRTSIPRPADGRSTHPNDRSGTAEEPVETHVNVQPKMQGGTRDVAAQH